MPANDESEPAAQPSDPVQRHLEHLTRLAIESVNQRDFLHDYESARGQEFSGRIAPDFKATFDNYPNPLTWQDLNSVWRRRTEEDPKLHFTVLSMSSDVWDYKDLATVLMEIKIDGVDGVELVALNEIKWRRDSDQRWVIYHFLHMRGITGNMGFV